jgi:hypothetical protein
VSTFPLKHQEIKVQLNFLLPVLKNIAKRAHGLRAFSLWEVGFLRADKSNWPDSRSQTPTIIFFKEWHTIVL